MKVFISVDMEGLSGVVTGEQTDESHLLYKNAQKWMIGDVNAAIEGVLSAGATEIIVNDSHGKMTNLVLEDLNPQAKLVSGVNKPLFQMEGVQECDAAMFVGYHSRAGMGLTTLDHTYWGSLIDGLMVNGEEVGEPEFNAILAGAFDVPVVFLSGDEVTCRETRAFIGEWLEVAAVKQAVGRCSAICLHPDVTAKLIAEGAERGLRNLSKAAACRVDLPMTLDIRFRLTQMADQGAIYPSATRLDGRTVRVQAETVEEGYRAMLTLFALARNAMP